MLAFDLADRYRNPVIVLADGFIGQMMEPVELPGRPAPPPAKAWACRGDAATRKNLITLHLPGARRAGAAQPQARGEVRAGVRGRRSRARGVPDRGRRHGRSSATASSRRIAATAVDAGAQRGHRVGLLRPITLWPFPDAAPDRRAGATREALPRRRALATDRWSRTCGWPSRPRAGALLRPHGRQRAHGRGDPRVARRRSWEAEPCRDSRQLSRPETFYDSFERKGGRPGIDPLLPRLRPRHRAQATSPRRSTTRRAGPHHPRSARWAARCSPTTTSTSATSRRRTAARPAVATGIKRAQPDTHRHLATRATATWRPSAATRSSRPPTAARTSPSSSSTTPSTA